MQHYNLFVFDIEIIPDTYAVPNLTKLYNPNLEARRHELQCHHIKITDGRNSFPRQPFHKIVAIRCLETYNEWTNDKEIYYLKELQTGDEVNFDEKQLPIGFLYILSAHNPGYSAKMVSILICQFLNTGQWPMASILFGCTKLVISGIVIQVAIVPIGITI